MSDPATEHYFTTEDDLGIYYRDFGAQQEGTPVICLAGLTRNSRDFEDLAPVLSARRRVLTIDFRGRGRSDYDPEWRNYHPATYVADVWRLLDQLAIPRIIVIGTSLGGLCAMTMAEEQRERVAGVVLNDVGPEVNPAGLARVQAYTGRLGPVADWDEAAAQTRDVYGEWLPGLTDGDFMVLARRAYREDDEGVPRLDMDPNIGRAIREVGAQKGDPWARFAALRGIPTALLWGSMSDILTEDIVDRMREACPELVVVPIAERGHVPLLDEPACLDAIGALLDRVP